MGNQLSEDKGVEREQNSCQKSNMIQRFLRRSKGRAIVWKIGQWNNKKVFCIVHLMDRNFLPITVQSFSEIKKVTGLKFLSVLRELIISKYTHKIVRSSA